LHLKVIKIGNKIQAGELVLSVSPAGISNKMDKIKDNKIPTKEKNIAYHSCSNRAVEILKALNKADSIDLLVKTTDSLYHLWVIWYNESEARSELKKCPQCTSPLKVVPAGKAKATGNPYSAFYACDSCGYKKSIEKPKVDDKTNLPAEERVVESPMPEQL